MHVTIGGEIMANIKQQIKRVKTNEKARQANVSFKSSLKTAMKAVLAAVENKKLFLHYLQHIKS